MKFHRTPALAPVLALLLVLTAQGMAVVRGASAATGQMELCVGQSVVLVYTDADGNPTAAPHLCPDCALAGLQAVLDEVPAILRPLDAARKLTGTRSGLPASTLSRIAYQPRAPPVML
jgi:hypothetical protein